MSSSIPTTGAAVLQSLRVSLHIMFAVLLAAGVTISLQDSHLSTVAKVGATHGAVALGVFYVVGTVLENRYARAIRQGRTGFNPRPFASAWLGCVVALWVVLMVMSSGFTWLVFPLMFLALHVLPTRTALFTVLALTVFTVGFPFLRTESPLDVTLSPGVILGPVLGALIAVIMSFAYRALHQDALRQARIADQLRAAQAQLAQQEHESGRLEERERLAREIHDTLAQGLSSIVLMSRATSAAFEQGRNGEVADALHLIETSAHENLAEARRFIHDLASPALDTALVPALRRLCTDTQAQELAKGTPLTCTLRVDGVHGEETSDEHLPAETRQALLRIAQGSLANITAHARATHSAVTLGIWANEVTLDIFDNGRGFTPAELSEYTSALADTTGHTGYGLTSLRARVHALGGTLTVDSTPGEGTVISAHIPLTQQK
ncbi:sensor histidine kinase [Rothia sp. ZJ1223]|uniref:sensor histidine kinase n=1 Tax=Rothia sp. ZJ1223 TaxID=2811098 RepID=UPI00195D40AC|nr:sensor histidine kinase [Rothia sp. ZJ1223]MBM7051556.1 sensor histidine kinase [Rothia sp. ZJ1223]